LAASTGEGIVPVGHTCPHSALAQSYRTAWRLHRKLEYITKVQSMLCIIFQILEQIFGEKKSRVLLF
jgi:hypothetical protein